MTDLPAPPIQAPSNNSYPPASSVARFGVSFVGPTFMWAWAEKMPDSDEMEVHEREFRAHPGLSFEEQVAYQRSLTMLQATAVIEQRRLADVLDVIAKTADGEDPTPAITKLADEVAAGEAERWAMQVDQVVMLVAPADRDEFRRLVSTANPVDLRELKAHLVDVVINRTIKTVQVAGAVDPTSPGSSAG